MTTLQLLKSDSFRVGPLDVLPLRIEGVSKTDYEVPPKIDQLSFNELGTEGGPSVGYIEIGNPDDTPVLIPEGWIIGANLLQTRVMNRTTCINAFENVVAEVSCVERGRWREESNNVDCGRSPLRVFSAGWEHETKTGTWRINQSQRQSRVWEEVSRHELRSGQRPTSSLAQIMREDSVTTWIPRYINETARREPTYVYGQNGVLISYEGSPLFMEIFSKPEAMRKTLQQTLNAMSFDLDHMNYQNVELPDVESFIKSARLGELHFISDDDWAVRMAGGTNGIDTKASVDQHGGLIHATAINRNHRILMEV
jgi:hypothetical protein